MNKIILPTVTSRVISKRPLYVPQRSVVIVWFISAGRVRLAEWLQCFGHARGLGRRPRAQYGHHLRRPRRVRAILTVPPRSFHVRPTDDCARPSSVRSYFRLQTQISIIYFVEFVYILHPLAVFDHTWIPKPFMCSSIGWT